MKLKKINLITFLLFIVIASCDVFLAEEDSITKRIPTDVIATSGELDQITISWGSHKNFDHSGLNIYRSEKESSGFILIGSTSDGAWRYIDKEVLPTATYYYYVTYEYGSSEGESSAIVSGYSYFNTQDFIVTESYDNLTFTWEERKGIDFYRLYQENPETNEPVLVVDNITGSSTSYTPTGLSHKYLLGGVVGETEGVLNKSSLSYGLVRLGTPGNLVLTETSTDITITWDPVLDADYYKIKHYSGNDSSSATYIVEDLQKTTYTHLTPDYNERNYYYVTAHTNGGGYSHSAYDYTVTLYPDRPENSKLERLSYNSLKFTWDPVNGATSYKVYQEDASLFNNLLKTEVITNSAIIDTSGFDLDRNYYFMVTTLIGDKESYTTNSITYKHINKPILSEVLDSSNGPYITWDKGIVPTGYKINVYRSESALSGYTKIYSELSYDSGALKDYVIDSSSLITGRYYYYKIESVNNGIVSDRSNYKRVLYNRDGTGL